MLTIRKVLRLYATFGRLHSILIEIVNSHGECAEQRLPFPNAVEIQFYRHHLSMNNFSSRIASFSCHKTPQRDDLHRIKFQLRPLEIFLWIRLNMVRVTLNRCINIVYARFESIRFRKAGSSSEYQTEWVCLRFFFFLLFFYY